MSMGLGRWGGSPSARGGWHWGGWVRVGERLDEKSGLERVGETKRGAGGKGDRGKHMGQG
jgi:hypothetical protein